MESLFDAVLSPLPAPQPAFVLASAALALVVVAVQPVWRWARGVVTLAHEGGHAVGALLTGRQLSGIRVHLDTSGVTLSRGRPGGPGMVVTLLAGYTAPALLGLAAAALVAGGRAGLLLATATLALLAMLAVIRNVVGFLAVVLTGGGLALVLWFGSADVRGLAGYAFAWFLLLGSVRAVFELGGSRRQRSAGLRGAPASDADQLAAITRVPALLWVGVFVLVCVGALALGAWLLWPEALLLPSLPGLT